MNRACFPKEKHQNSQKWAKFMNFLFWPFLLLGLLGRLRTNTAASPKDVLKEDKPEIVDGNLGTMGHLSISTVGRFHFSKILGTGSSGWPWFGLVTVCVFGMVQADPVFGSELRPERPFTGVSGPSGPEIAKKCQKESFRGSAKKSPKAPEKVKKCPKLDFSGHFLPFLGIFGDFLQTPEKTLFDTFFAISGPEGPETPVNGRSGHKF